MRTLATAKRASLKTKNKSCTSSRGTNSKKSTVAYAIINSSKMKQDGYSSRRGRKLLRIAKGT